MNLKDSEKSKKALKSIKRLKCEYNLLWNLICFDSEFVLADARGFKIQYKIR